MLQSINEDRFEPEYGVLHHEEGVDLIPGNIELAGLEVALVNELSRERMKRVRLRKRSWRTRWMVTKLKARIVA